MLLAGTAAGWQRWLPTSQHAYSYFYSPETLHSQCHGLAKVLASTAAFPHDLGRCRDPRAGAH